MAIDLSWQGARLRVAAAGARGIQPRFAVSVPDSGPGLRRPAMMGWGPQFQHKNRRLIGLAKVCNRS